MSMETRAFVGSNTARYVKGVVKAFWGTIVRGRYSTRKNRSLSSPFDLATASSVGAAGVNL